MQRPIRLGALALALAPLLALPQAAAAADLVQVWQAALQNDRDFAVARAAHESAAPRRDQATALWRPNVGFSATVGAATSETDTSGARFSAPGFGESTGVGFSTSVTGGTLGRWSLQASQPLYDPERRAQQQQLRLSADVADSAWQADQQTLALRTAERYFDVALAEESLRVLTSQQTAVQRAADEAQDRFQLGSVPVTDTQEARARLAAVRAQLLAAESDLQLKRGLLADSTGLALAQLDARLPIAAAAAGAPRPLDAWRTDAEAGNPGLRMQQLAAEVARQDAAKYSLAAAPKVDLVAQASRDRLSGSGDYGPAGNTGVNQMIGIQVSIPLFTGGYRSAKQAEALRLADKAAAEVDRTRQQIAQQVRAAWVGLSVGAERARALDEALKAAEARLAATRLGHDVGDRTTLDLLNAENDTASARLALAQARVGLLMDRLRLDALAGRLDEGALRAADAELEPVPGR